MNHKKWVALVLILLLSMGLLTGCSPVEMEYYNLTTEASNVKVYEGNGSIELSLAQLPESMFEGEEFLTKELFIKAINQHRIDYWGKVNLDLGIFQYAFTIVDNTTGEKSAFTSLIYKDDVFYVKIDDMISYFKKFGDPELNQKLDQLYGDVQYVSVSSQDIETMMPPGSQNGLTGNFMQKSSQQQLVMLRLYEGLLDKVYDKYESNLISKSDNKYTFTLRGADSIEIIKPVAIYTIKNIDKLGPFLKTFLNSLSEDEMTNLGLTSEMKNEALTGIAIMVLMVNHNRDNYLNEIEKMATTAEKDLVQTVNDSEIVSSIEKRDPQTYDMTSKIRIHITAGTPIEELDYALNIKQTLKACGSIQIASPTGRVTTIKDFEKRIPPKMDVKVDDGIYYLEQGFGNTDGSIYVHLENNRSYVPLRLVAESMEENVGWDEASQQAFVERNGQRIFMTGMIVDDEIIVKSRDFENLGYKIGWNDSTRTVTIEK